MTRAIIILLAGVFTMTGYAQTSEDNPRLKKALQQHPQADADKDGVLTKAEALAYRKKMVAQRGGQNAGGRQAKGASAPEGGERHVYKTVGDVELPLYIYSPEGHKADNKTPAIVFFFGGGWKGGSPTQFEHHCKYLASRGMVAITVEYRVSSRHQIKVEDCIEDAKSAMRWVRANAAKLGVDPDRVGSGGGSAGGHLGACVAVIDDFNAKTDDLSVDPKPNAMVLFNPAVGLSKEQLAENDLDKAGERTHGPVEKAFPLAYADKKQAPCIMFFGTEDRLLLGAQDYKKESKAAGNDCRIVTYEGQGHSFFNYGRAGGKYFKLTVAEMDKFLVELGWLAGE
jgi:acetyl esterase/lipase